MLIRYTHATGAASGRGCHPSAKERTPRGARTKRRGRRPRLTLDLLGHRGGLLLHLVHAADHVEGLLREGIVGAGEQLLEARDDLGERDELARLASEDLGDVEGLREEALDLTRARR